MKTLRPVKIFAFGLVVILVLLTNSVAQGACGREELARVDRLILVMRSGSVYRIFNNNGVDIAFWMPLSKVAICEQLTDNGELYYTISNEDENQTVFAVRER